MTLRRAFAFADGPEQLFHFLSERSSLNQSSGMADRQLEQGGEAMAALITLALGLVLTSRGFWKWLLVFLAIGFVWRLVQ